MASALCVSISSSDCSDITDLPWPACSTRERHPSLSPSRESPQPQSAMPICVGEGEPDPGLSIAESVLLHLRKHSCSNAPAQVDAHTGRAMSFRELLVQTVHAAEGWRAQGLVRGDVVALFSRNYHEVFPAVLGAILAGCTVSCCVPISNVAELRHAISLCNPKVVLSEPEKLAIAQEAVPDLVHVTLFGTPPPNSGVVSFSDILRRGAAANPDPDTYVPVHVPDRSEHVAFILYSSGTTGLPKGVMLRDEGLIRLIANAMFWACAPGDRFLCNSPLSWISGEMILLLCTASGSTRVFMTDSNEYSILETMEKYKVNRWIGAPPVLMGMANVVRTKKYDLSSVQMVASGGAALAANVHTDCMKALGFPIYQAYGATEIGIISGTTDFSKAPKPGSMGCLAPGITVKFVNPDTQKEVTEPGQAAEVRVLSPYIMKGYIRNPEATTAAFDDDGFYITGDMVYMDEDGDLFFVDRLKEMLKYKSIQIAPAEVESVLMDHPEVREACVLGKYDPAVGDLVTAFVVRAPGSAVTAGELQDLVASRLSDHKRLRGGVVFMDRLPRTVSGKTERRTLKNMLQDMPLQASLSVK